jgi:hypothetical protein
MLSSNLTILTDRFSLAKHISRTIAIQEKIKIPVKSAINNLFINVRYIIDLICSFVGIFLFQKGINPHGGGRCPGPKGLIFLNPVDYKFLYRPVYSIFGIPPIYTSNQRGSETQKGFCFGDQRRKWEKVSVSRGTVRSLYFSLFLTHIQNISMFWGFAQK